MKNNGLSIAGFVVSIVAFVAFGIICGPAGLVLSWIGRNKAVAEGDKTGLATAGMVLGAVATIMTLFSYSVLF